jgi:hypothetical protein
MGIILNIVEEKQFSSLRDLLLPLLLNWHVSFGVVEEQLGMVAEGRESYGKN